MNVEASNKMFNKDTASTYDNKREKLIPIKDALHLCIRMLLLKSPSIARVLCVGAGTGAEVIYLAHTFPEWSFTVVEPSSAMLEICRQRTTEHGISSRCTFHEGYLDSLPDSGAFDVATSILVSHFIVNARDRGNFYSEIASRLRPGAYMINADLASDMSTSTYRGLLDVWVNMNNYAEMPIRVESFGNKVAMLPIKKVESMIASSGFDKPVLFFQTLLIHAWFSKVSSDGKKA